MDWQMTSAERAVGLRLTTLPYSDRPSIWGPGVGEQVLLMVRRQHDAHSRS